MQMLDPRAFWLFLFNSVLAGFGVLFGIVFALGGFFIARSDDGGPIELLTPMVLGFAAFVLFVVVAWIWSKLTYHFYRYELREDGFRKEHGVIWKKYVTIPYDRIQNVDIHRGILARILGLSDLQIQTAGGITAGSYGAFSEGRLPGLRRELAEEIRDDLVSRVRGAKSQGL